MKKFLKVLIVIIVVAVLGGFVMLKTLDVEKEAMTSEEFKAFMEDKGFQVIDATSQLEGQNPALEKVYIAMKDDYQIEFFELSDVEITKQVYAGNVNTAKATAGSSRVTTNVDMNNYNKYSLQSDGQYTYISRIDSTMIFIRESETHKDTIKTLMKEIGY